MMLPNYYSHSATRVQPNGLACAATEPTAMGRPEARVPGVLLSALFRVFISLPIVFRPNLRYGAEGGYVQVDSYDITVEKLGGLMYLVVAVRTLNFFSLRALLVDGVRLERRYLSTSCFGSNTI
jgi:hypothetical protein